jgi:phage repressor protein C with HTH and peptisase S24 domain
MPSTFEEVLTRVCEATGTTTQVELAGILNIRQSSISDAKRRDSVPSEWYLKLLRSHGLNPDWLEHGTEPKYLNPAARGSAIRPRDDAGTDREGRNYFKTRVVTVSSLGGQTPGADQWQPDTVMRLSIPEPFYRSSLQVIRMDGSNMEPVIRRDALVGVDVEQKKVLSGEVYAAMLPAEGLVLRRIFLDADKGLYVLRSERPGYPESNLDAERMERRVVGRVVWVMQPV